MKFLYKNKEYSFEELIEHQSKFEGSLKQPTFLIIDGQTDFLCFDPGYKLAIDFFQEFYNQMSSARFALAMGHKKIHDSNFVSWKSGSVGQLWLRFQYLKNAINWYNSLVDISNQAIWFGFNLYKVIQYKSDSVPILEISSKETFNTLLKRCNSTNIVNALNIIIKSNSKNTGPAKKLLRIISGFKKTDESKTVLDWANNLKHHGKFTIKEFYNPSGALKVRSFNSEFANPVVIEIDHISEILKQYHISILEMITEVHAFFNFNDIIPEEVNGEILFSPKKASEYKPIIV